MNVTLWEHVLLFMAISLVVSLVYNGLRQDDLKTIILLGLKRFVYFMLAGFLLAVGSFFLVKSL
jgi:hypothetical protein